MALELVVWVSGQAGQASRALQVLKRSAKPAARNAAVLIRDGDGDAFVFETGDVDPQQGMLLGAIVGLLVETLGRSDPECVADQTASMDLSEEYLAELWARLQPGGSALVLLLETKRVKETLDLLATLRGRVWQQVLSDHLVAEFTTGMVLEGR